MVVADSFLGGSEVGDLDAWPSLLGMLTKNNYLNFGVDGYGVDQINLNAVILAEKMPRLDGLIMGYLLPSDLQRIGFVSYGKDKPF